MGTDIKVALGLYGLRSTFNRRSKAPFSRRDDARSS